MDPVHLDDRLAIDQRPPNGKGSSRISDRGETVGPVMPAAGSDRDVAILDPDYQPVAIPLDLMHPIVTSRHIGLESG